MNRFESGMRVKVVKAADNIFNMDYMFRTGIVVGFDDIECGASPEDHMIIVYFDKAVRTDDHNFERVIIRQDAFWSEELEIIQ